MKKTKLLLLSALTVSAMMFGTACAKETAPTAAPTEAVTTEIPETDAAAETETTKAETAKPADGAEKADEKQMTGVLEENKGFMFTFTNDADKETYALNVEDEVLLKDVKDGDKITVTYTGEDPIIGETTDTVIVKVEKSK